MLFREASCSTTWATRAAIAWLLFVIVLVLTLAALRLRPEARLLRGRRAMTARLDRRLATSRGRAFSDAGRSRGATASSSARRRCYDVRADHHQRLPAAAAVHGHDGVPAARPVVDAGRAGLAGRAADRRPTRARTTRSTPSRSRRDDRAADARSRRAASRAPSSTRPTRPRRRSSGRAAGGRSSRPGRSRPRSTTSRPPGTS